MRTATARLVLAPVLLACTSSEEPTEQPASTPSPPPAIVEREPAPEPPSEREFFLAYVSQTGVEHCPDGHTFEWLDVRTTLGFVPTQGRSLEPWLGKVVLAKGESTTRTPPPDSLPSPAPCPIMQMRSDWRNTPAGMRIDRGDHPNIEAFALASVEALPLELVREGDEIVVTFTNPLPFALDELGFIGHYEGCYGKPGSKHVGVDDVPLAVGASITKRLPILAEDHDKGPAPERKGGPEARVHLLDSIQLYVEPSKDAPPLHVDLDAPMSAFGLELACPEREPAGKARPD